LLSQPANSTCEWEAGLFSCLTEAGATIQEINTIRKHTSLARGGYLAKYAYPARIISLIFSDIPGNNLEFVASGPTVKDTTTIDDAKRIAFKYDVGKKCANPSGGQGFKIDHLTETPKEEKYFEKVDNIIVSSNTIALEAMLKRSRDLGYSARIVDDRITGEAREIGRKIAHEIRAEKSRSILLYGGETTVTINNPGGKGGRNQELALSALEHITRGNLVASIASDGQDNSDFGGAICDIITKEEAEKLNTSPQVYLENNNSYEFFSRVNDCILTGNTGSNVSDLIIAIND
ncbi:MAG: DUF4147 domain-containing protein, partial [Patescibacteria group bacterium]